MSANQKRWSNLCEGLGIQNDLKEYERIESAYTESRRAYHTLQHLNECLKMLDWAVEQGGIDRPALVELALWYHDAIYRPRASDNELKSAEWACAFASSAGMEESKLSILHELIMSTCHGEKPTDPLAQWTVDIDLSILGSEVSRFDEYEEQVRREYKWVPAFIYKSKRKEVLEQFLNASNIYNTQIFRENFEEGAKENLRRSISRLSS